MFTSTTSTTTSTTTTTTISITVTVYNGCWGSRCLGYSKFFFFTLLFFLLNQYLQLEPPLPQWMANFYMSLSPILAPGQTGLEMQCFSSQRYVFFCFFLFFFLILLTLFYRSPQSVNWPPPQPLFPPPQHIHQTQTGHHLDNSASSASGAFLFDLNTWRSTFKTIKFLGFLVS